MALRKAVKPVIIGISNIRLTDDERKLLKDHSPLGIILFARNIEKNDKGKQNKEVLAQLIADIKEIRSFALRACLESVLSTKTIH